jgi:hypothetical protein
MINHQLKTQASGSHLDTGSNNKQLAVSYIAQENLIA